MLLPGNHIATACAASIWESDGGALMLTFALEVQADGGDPERLTAHQCLVMKDGTISTITVENCKACWGWDGQDPFWLTEPANLAGKQVEIVCVEESFIGRDGTEKTGIKVKYINPPGGGARLPESADRAKILNKYGAKFRALSGGVPVKKLAAAPKPVVMAPQAPPPPAQAPPPPAPAGPTTPCRMEDAWAALCHTLEGSDRKLIEGKWFAIVNRLYPGRSNSDITPEEWGAVRDACEDNLPF